MRASVDNAIKIMDASPMNLMGSPESYQFFKDRGFDQEILAIHPDNKDAYFVSFVERSLDPVSPRLAKMHIRQRDMKQIYWSRISGSSINEIANDMIRTFTDYLTESNDNSNHQNKPNTK